MSELLTRKQVAEILGVPVNWLARGAMGLNASKSLPYIKYGKRMVRYEKNTVEVFKQSHTLKKTA